MELPIIILAMILVFIGPLALTFGRRLFDKLQQRNLRRRISSERGAEGDSSRTADGSRGAHDASGTAPTSFDAQAREAQRTRQAQEYGTQSSGMYPSGIDSYDTAGEQRRADRQSGEEPADTRQPAGLEMGWRPGQPGGVAAKLDTAENLSVFKPPEARYSGKPGVQRFLRKLDRYPPLQRAVIWSEILSPPKSVRSPRQAPW